MKRLIVWTQAGGKRHGLGGVDLKNARLSQVRLPNIEIIASSEEGLPRDVRAAKNGTIVYVQTEGGLNKKDGVRLGDLLAMGARVVEVNVFALPSKWRPEHPLYRMAVLSRDGLYRYAFRSYLNGWKPQARIAVLPNALVHPQVKPKGTLPPTKQVRFLRIGRPDPVKWTEFEVKFCNLWAMMHPNADVVLTLVGAPPDLSGGILGTAPNLRVSVIEYTPDPGRLYRTHDVYIHHSAIGETYGNTIDEALAHSLKVIVALDPVWDCGPLDFVPKVQHIVASPNTLLRNPLRIDEVIFGGAPEDPHRSAQVTEYAQEVIGVAETASTEYGCIAPTLSECGRYLADVARRLGESPTATMGRLLAHEARRAVGRRTPAHYIPKRSSED